MTVTRILSLLDVAADPHAPPNHRTSALVEASQGILHLVDELLVLAADADDLPTVAAGLSLTKLSPADLLHSYPPRVHGSDPADVLRALVVAGTALASGRDPWVRVAACILRALAPRHAAVVAAYQTKVG